MSHRERTPGLFPSVAPELHPVCPRCCGMPLSGVEPQPAPGRPVSFRTPLGRVDRYAGADVERCCFCGDETGDAYYARQAPDHDCLGEPPPPAPPVEGVDYHAWDDE